MPTVPSTDPRADADIERELLRDPKVQKALATLDDPQDKEDLIDALIVSRRIKEGKERAYPLEEVLEKLGL